MPGYISKDFVHFGCGLPLKPDSVWTSIPYSVQKNIRKAESSGVTIKKVLGKKGDIVILRSMWYDPNDPNMPSDLSENEFMFIAYDKTECPVGAVILLPVGNHLFLNNLAGSEEGKKLRVQDYILWHCVNYFSDSDYKYIDVGVSYRQTLYDFFKKWQVISYPVIFNVPQNKLNISIYPFNSYLYNSYPDDSKIKYVENEFSKILNNRKYTFVPNIEEAKKILHRLNYEYIERTYTFDDISSENPFVIDLTKIFSVQFGVLIVNLQIDDKAMWNVHRAWDPFKKNISYTNLADELLNFDLIIAKRKRNIEIIGNYFSLEDIRCNKKDELIPSAFYFIYQLNNNYHNKLNDFAIPHYFNSETNEIGIPIHQNIKKSELEYLYAIFRGVLNLCSEWEFTGKYSDLK